MIKGFKDFILRGNVVDLAVAVVIGTAFAAIVKGFTDNVINPLIASVGGANPGEGLGFFIRDGNPKTYIDIGDLIGAVINFAIVAAVVYFLIVAPMTHLLERRRRGEEPQPVSPPEDILLLQEIRDLLRDRPTSTQPQP